MKYFDTFLQGTRKPSIQWHEALQAAVDKRFENASTYQEGVVEEEIEFGTLEFRPINCRVTSLVNATTGQRINDDYKKIIFPDLSYKPKLGSRYRFDNNIWLVYSTDNILSATSNVYIRRCNNTLNIEDKYGNIYREPCYIDYKINETQLQREYSIEVPSGRLQVQCQYNEHTKDIRINNRFLFGKNAYKVRSCSDYDRRSTFDDKSARVLSFYIDYDNISKDDRFDLGVANYKEYNYKITANTYSIDNIVGYSGEIKSNVILDNEIVNEPIVWTSTNLNIASIDNNGKFVLNSLGQCDLIGSMVNNNDIKLEIKVTVTDALINKSEVIISPNVHYIKLNEAQQYSVFEYINGNKTGTIFDFEFTGTSNRNYKVLENNDNHFTILNIKQSLEPLIVICRNTNDNSVTEIHIELGGLI